MAKKLKNFTQVYNIHKVFGGGFIKLATSAMIRDIDSFAENELRIPVTTLMERSGKAVACAVKSIIPKGARICILCGCGNNGGDGYAAALELMDDYAVKLYDVFGKGQKSDAGKHFRQTFADKNGSIFCGLPTEESLANETDVLVDAVFGTGFLGSVPEELVSLSNFLNTCEHLKVVAVDIPLGVSSDDGAVSDFALRADVTVALSFPKVAMFSYPAKEYVGRVIIDDLGLDEACISNKFSFENVYVDFAFARSLLPKRSDNSNKGSFGKALLIVGSSEYMGASALALESALRGGAGYVSFAGDDKLCDFLLTRFPEALYNRASISDTERILKISERQDSIIVGSGSGCTEEIYNLVRSLLKVSGAPIIIDADGINAISKYGSLDDLKSSRRAIILTPHPLEFSRLSGISVNDIGKNRYGVAKKFAEEFGVTLLLKGAATVVTDGRTTFINGSGSSALAKAGSGDVLAGLLASILAYKKSPVESAALAAYIHGRCGDLLANEYSSYGVTPSDIPKIATKVMAELERGEENGIS